QEIRDHPKVEDLPGDLFTKVVEQELDTEVERDVLRVDQGDRVAADDKPDGNRSEGGSLEISATLVVRGPGHCFDRAEAEEQRHEEAPGGEVAPEESNGGRNHHSDER